MRTRPNTGSVRLRRLARLSLVVVVLLASGCSAIGSGSLSGTAEQLPTEREAADRYAELETINATVTTVQERDNATTTTVSRKQQRLDPYAYHDRVLSVNASADANPPLVAEGGFVIANGSTLVFYDPAAERLHRASIASDNDSVKPDYPELLGAARSGRAVGKPTVTPGISPLPAVPRTDGEQNSSTAYGQGNVTVTYAGTETVDGRTTYRLEVTPASDAMALESQTLWLDREYVFPIKRQTVSTYNGNTYESTITYRNVSFNPTIEPETFELQADEVPDDAERVRSSSYDSRAALANATELSIPDPTVPSGFEFASASHRTTEPEFAVLQYEQPRGDGQITVSIVDEPRTVSNGTTVQIGPYEARQTRTDDRTSITWNADGDRYHVTGQVDNATLRRVARSVAETT
ncbi:hypothetical protein [Haloarcula halophila]|uniref:hypothetical protein n=1 Tax=Haloarcula TaxID=2237 RepID=UPI0023E46C79|nr:hypothetical protein [Halomicroarcula sp. DFY41]